MAHVPCLVGVNTIFDISNLISQSLMFTYRCRCLVYGNTAAGLWALFSSLPAGLVLYQHLRFKSASLAQTLPPSRLIALRNVALVCSLVSGVATVAYPVTAIVNGQPMKPYSDSYVITGVWAFMSFKWSVGLAYFRYIPIPKQHKKHQMLHFQPSLPHKTAERSRVQCLLILCQA